MYRVSVPNQPDGLCRHDRHGDSSNFPDLKKAGVVLKRAVYFITCQGRQMYPLKLHEDFILRSLLSAQSGGRSGPAETITYRQLSLFEREATAFMKYHKGGRCYDHFSV